MTTESHLSVELAHRVSGGIDVTLYWSPRDDSTTIEIVQAELDEVLTFGVAPESALDAFYHPFAHLPVGRDELAHAL